MTIGYVKCKNCGGKLYKGHIAYYHDGDIYCSETCLSETCEITLEEDDLPYEEEITDHDVDAYNDDVKLGII